MNASTGGSTSTSTSAASTAYAARQPTCAMRYCASGAKTMPPAEMPAVAMPSARPRRTTNQRATAVLFGRAPMQVEPSATGPARQRYSAGSDRTLREQEEAERHDAGAERLDQPRAATVDEPSDDQAVPGRRELA